MPENPILFQSPRLTVEIAQPGSVYRRTRFDWTAFITQVTLDGKHTFCVPEDYDPAKGTGGIGLCNEFGIEAPIGYDDAQVGDAFPKLGIGLLKKDSDAPYNFFRPYEIVQPFPVEIQTQADAATFVVQPLECRGYAARLTKTVRVAENTLEIHYLLQNTGVRPIATHEYCHNFIGINQTPVGPDYTLHFPYPVQFQDDIALMRANVPPEMRQLPPEEIDRRIREYIQGSRANLNVQENRLSLHATPERPFYCRPIGFFATEQPQWQLTHASGLTMSETDDFTPWRVAVWGVGHVISAEIFVDIRLEPGQSQEWTRRFEFNTPGVSL
jgi:hypothetical protein